MFTGLLTLQYPWSFSPVAIDSGLIIVTYSVLYKQHEAQWLAGCQWNGPW